MDDDYYIKKTLIKSEHSINPDLLARIKANPNVLDSTAPKIAAQFCSIYDLNKKQVVYGRSPEKRHQVASLTKIMTFYTIVELAKKYKVNLSSTYIEVCHAASVVIGSSARLRNGDILTAE